MLKVQQFTFNMFGVHTYIVFDPATLESAIIDPGMMSAQETSQLDKFITAHQLTVKHLINTHMHIDHILGDAYVRNKYEVPIEGHIEDEFLGENVASQAAMFALDLTTDQVKTDVNLREGDKVVIGTDYLSVIHVPGHSPGSIMLYSPSSGFIIGGDVIFRDSIGRTDLPAGNHKALIDNIKSKVMTLPADTVIYPGHGPTTTVSYETAHNPFLM